METQDCSLRAFDHHPPSRDSSSDEVVFERAVDYRRPALLVAGSLVLLLVGLIAGLLPPPLLLGGFAAALAAAGASYVMRTRSLEKLRAQAMQAAATRLGMTYLADGGDAWLPWLRELQTVKPCETVLIWNLLQGDLDGVPIALADVRGVESEGAGFSGTVILLPATGEGPNFILRPVDWATGVRRLVSRRQMVLDESPQGKEFSRQYELWVDNPELPPWALPDNAAAFFAARPGWYVEKREGWFLIAKVPPRPPLAPPGAKSFRLSGDGPLANSPFVAVEGFPALIKHAVAIRALASS
jgi:hypothetical protein